MYATCIFCHSPLGANEAVEEFPVGRRLAFDAARGRLWAVCRACGRWNLSPLETRWEAVEACERAFRGTRVRVSTENVGLARLEEGTELVRVGKPLRPEFAAWRYGDQFARRARRRWVLAAGVGGLGAAVVGTALVSAPLLAFVLPPALAATAALTLRAPKDAVLAGAVDAQRALRNHGGEPLVRHVGEGILHARLHPQPRDDSRWWLQVVTARWDHGRSSHVHYRSHRLAGGPALQAAAVLLAQANAGGGSRREVQSAVSRIEQAGDPESYFKAVGRDTRRTGQDHQDLWRMPKEIRLALEMGAHEDAERRAMEGEMAELERQWRAAEEIAAIADRLSVPPEVESRLERMKRRLPKA